MNWPQTPTWPFPPATGPVPWTKKQIAAYERAQRKQPDLPNAPF